MMPVTGTMNPSGTDQVVATVGGILDESASTSPIHFESRVVMPSVQSDGTGPRRILGPLSSTVARGSVSLQRGTLKLQHSVSTLRAGSTSTKLNVAASAASSHLQMSFIQSTPVNDSSTTTPEDSDASIGSNMFARQPQNRRCTSDSNSVTLCDPYP